MNMQQVYEEARISSLKQSIWDRLSVRGKYLVLCMTAERTHKYQDLSDFMQQFLFKVYESNMIDKIRDTQSTTVTNG